MGIKKRHRKKSLKHRSCRFSLICKWYSYCSSLKTDADFIDPAQSWHTTDGSLQREDMAQCIQRTSHSSNKVPVKTFPLLVIWECVSWGAACTSEASADREWRQQHKQNKKLLGNQKIEARPTKCIQYVSWKGVGEKRRKTLKKSRMRREEKDLECKNITCWLS